MNIEQYRNEVTRTIVILDSLDKNLLHMAYGITTEVGELQDIYKRELAYGKQIDLVNLKEELGDILWYVWNGLNFLELTKEEMSNLTSELNDVIKTTINRKFNNIDLCIMLSKASHAVHSGVFNKDQNLVLTELISIYYSIFSFCFIYEFDICEIMEMNIEKLRKRFPEKFTQEQALNRNLEEERKTLENTQNK